MTVHSDSFLLQNLFLPAPSDSWPALAHHITGSDSSQHGIIYGDLY